MIFFFFFGFVCLLNFTMAAVAPQARDPADDGRVVSGAGLL